MKRDPLGRDPLSRGIFEKTTNPSEALEETKESPQKNQKPDSSYQKPEAGNQIPASRFQIPEDGSQKPETSYQKFEIATQKPVTRNQLPETSYQKPETGFVRDGERTKVTLQLLDELNEWLDDLVKKGRKKHGSKIQKQLWIQVALELFQAMPVDWLEIENPEQLKSKLEDLVSDLNEKTINHKP